jgi:asparagine synthase (glutamine-hydrolysing)
VCGIVGMIWTDPGRVEDREVVRRSLAAIRHRGPDGEGTLITPGFAGGMRRLAIIDLATGDQPIFNETGDLGVLFNGEIYNYRELRRLAESRGHRFRTESDTEVLVHLMEEFGPAFVSRLDGMFAFAIWDAPRRRCLLGRDRFGVKPLHLAWTKAGLAFASETKALAAAGWIRPELERSSLGSYMRFGWVPDPDSMWKGVARLPPGHTIEVVEGEPRRPVCYHRHTVGSRLTARSPRDVDGEIGSLLRAAVERQLVADVPVGLFLSGGLDSSLIAAAAHRLGRRLPCHTIEFRLKDHAEDPSEPDSPHARDLANRLGFDLHVHTIEPRAVDLLPSLMRAMDEPAGDPAIITAYLIGDAARSVSKVLLSGMGADELMGGYRRHLAAHALTPLYALPRAIRTPFTRIAHGWSRYMNSFDMRKYPALRRIQKASSSLPMDVSALPEAFATWTPPELIERLGLAAPESRWPAVCGLLDGPAPSDPVDACLAFDVTTYLPSHNLHYMDKATMAASVEVRVPFLDNELAAYMLALPHDEKVRWKTTKVALRRAGKDMLPPSILKRSKTGFGAPIRSWLSGELRPMVQELLSVSAVCKRGIFDPKGVERIVTLFERNEADLAYPVWFLLSFELWCQQVLDPANSVHAERGDGCRDR